MTTAGCSGIPGAGVVNDDADDGHRGRVSAPVAVRVRSAAYGVALRLNAVRVVRHVEVDRREAVAVARHRQRDGIDATERMPGCLRRRTAAAEGNGRSGVAAAGNVNSDAGHDAGGLDVRARLGKRACARDRHGRGRVVVTGVRDGQAGDGAVGADGRLSSRARACRRTTRQLDGRAERIGSSSDLREGIRHEGARGGCRDRIRHEIRADHVKRDALAVEADDVALCDGRRARGGWHCADEPGVNAIAFGRNDQWPAVEDNAVLVQVARRMQDVGIERVARRAECRKVLRVGLEVREGTVGKPARHDHKDGALTGRARPSATDSVVTRVLASDG